MGGVLVQPAGTSIFPAGSSSLVACDAHGIAALLPPSPTGNIDVPDPSHFPDKLPGPGGTRPAGPQPPDPPPPTPRGEAPARGLPPPPGAAPPAPHARPT